MNQLNQLNLKTLVRGIAIIVSSIGLVVLTLHIVDTVRAGSLTPSVAPASSMRTLEENYNALVGTFNSATTTASSTGNAMQIVKCAITKIQGGACP